MPKYKYSLVVCARWEENDIFEWIEYHKSLGFDHIYIYSNDDEPRSLFKQLTPYLYGQDPYVTYRYWPNVGEQPDIYLHFLDNFKHETEWYSCIDIDEFFVLKNSNNIEEFMNRYEEGVDCLYLNWVIFGHSGKLKRDQDSILLSYRRRANGPDVHTKMVCRSAAIDPEQIRPRKGGAYWHFLDNYKLPGVRCADVLNESTDGYSADFPVSAKEFISRDGYADAVLSIGYIAHFQFKSEEDFIRRWKRGGFTNSEQWRSIYENGQHKKILAENNAVYDTYLAEYWLRYTSQAMRFDPNTDSADALGIEQPYENVALHKPSWQSSVYQPIEPEPAASRVSGAANNGLVTSYYGFHTDFEAQPWWIVDLLGSFHIHEIHIYNRRDNPLVAPRTNAIEVLTSADNEDWVTWLTRSSAEPFGLDGKPLIVRVNPTGTYRFVMIRLQDVNCLHLDEVRVFGHEGTEKPMRPAPISPDLERLDQTEGAQSVERPHFHADAQDSTLEITSPLDDRQHAQADTPQGEQTDELVEFEPVGQPAQTSAAYPIDFDSKPRTGLFRRLMRRR
jgi:hypothetical protein